MGEGDFKGVGSNRGLIKDEMGKGFRKVIDEGFGEAIDEGLIGYIGPNLLRTC